MRKENYMTITTNATDDRSNEIIELANRILGEVRNHDIEPSLEALGLVVAAGLHKLIEERNCTKEEVLKLCADGIRRQLDSLSVHEEQ